MEPMRGREDCRERTGMGPGKSVGSGQMRGPCVQLPEAERSMQAQGQGWESPEHPGPACRPSSHFFYCVSAPWFSAGRWQQSGGVS